MITFEIDKVTLEKTFREEFKKRLDQIEHRSTLWDMKELCRQTNMSENNIKDKFFWDTEFPKYKVGSKWYFPAKECEEFLIKWIASQPRN